MTNIITSLLLLFLGDVLVFALTIFLIGFMFLLRVMLNIWFDTDFFKRIEAWFKGINEKANAKMRRKNKEIEKQIDEANKLLIIDRGEFEDVPEQE